MKRRGSSRRQHSSCRCDAAALHAAQKASQQATVCDRLRACSVPAAHLRSRDCHQTHHDEMIHSGVWEGPCRFNWSPWRRKRRTPQVVRRLQRGCTMARSISEPARGP